MADTKIEDLTDGTTANATDRIPVTRDPTGTPVNRYVTPAYIRSYITGQVNNWAGSQNIVASSNTTPQTIAGYSVTGSNTNPFIDWSGAVSGSAALDILKISIADSGFSGSKANSRLLALDAGSAGTTEMFGVSLDGQVFVPGGIIDGPGTASGITMRAGASNFCRFTNDGSIFRKYLAVGGSSLAVNAYIENRSLAAGLVDVHNSTTGAVNFSIYHTRDASITNYSRLSIASISTEFTLTCESGGTGGANLDLAFIPKGTGRVKFGTHSAIGAETVTGYIEIKDAGGTTRKLAVVS